MKKSIGLWVLAAAIGSWAFASQAVAQHGDHDGHDHGKHGSGDGHGDHGDHGDEGAGGYDQDEMGRLMAAATPGEHHEHLKAWVGSWSTKSKFKMAPDTPWMESTGSSEITEAIGGRFLVENASGDMMGMPFMGLGIYGYDNFRGQYTSVWMDSWGTAISPSTGKCDQSGKTVTYTGTYDDPGKNKKGVKYRLVRRVINENSHVMEMYGIGPDGKEYKSMELTYTRK